MKTIRLIRFRKILIILFFTFLFVNSNALYLGWDQNKIDKYLNRYSSQEFEVREGNAEVAYYFEGSKGITRMVFHLNTEGKCYAFSIIYDLRYAGKLSKYIKNNFSYNSAEDVYENKKLKLYYEGGRTQHKIYITDKGSNAEMNISMK